MMIKYRLIIITVGLLAIAASAFCQQSQASSFVNWEIVASDLTSGKLAFSATETRMITYKVTVQRFLLPGGAWQDVNLDVMLLRIHGTDEPWLLGYTETITSSDFPADQAIITKTFTAGLETNEDSQNTSILKPGDEVALAFHGSDGTGGIANKTYEVILGTSPSTPPPPSCVGWEKPNPPSSVSLVAIGPKEMYVTWQDNSNNEDSFRVRISWEIDGLLKNKIYWAPANSSGPYIVSVPYENGQYRAEVRAYNCASSDPAYSPYNNTPSCVPIKTFAEFSPTTASATTSESIVTHRGFTFGTARPIYFKSPLIRLLPSTTIPAGARVYLGNGSCTLGGSGGGGRPSLDFLSSNSNLAASNTEDLAVGVYVYPNPVKHSVTIRSVPAFREGAEIVLMDVRSHVVRRENVVKNQGQIIWTVDDLPSGVYIAIINDGQRRTTQKVIIP